MIRSSVSPRSRHEDLPRGLRNRNPLNIRIGNVWLGEEPNPTDPSFEQFVAMEYGVRAAFVLLRRYIRHYRRTTIRAVVQAWAPANENNVEAYVDTVAKHSGIDPDDTLDYGNVEQMVALFQGMCLVENGRTLDEKIVRKGYDLT